MTLIRLWSAFISAVVFSVLISSRASAITLNELIQTATEKSETLQAADKTIQAAEAEIRGRDLVLSPRFDSEVSSIREAKASLLPINRYRSQLLTASLSKLFETGTTLTAAIGNEISDNSTFGLRDIGTWEFRIAQSFWRDGFGRATKYRHEGEANELRTRTLTATYQKQTFLVDLEAAYWDLILARRQQDIQKSNLQKSEAVSEWTKNRVRRSTAEQTDLIQAEALVSSRQLDLHSLNNTILTLENRIRQLVPGLAPESWTVDLKELETARSIDTLISGTGSNDPVRLDSLSANFRAKQASAEASRVDQMLKPRLDAYASYGQSGADSGFGKAWENSTDPQFQTSKVGVQFSVELDWTLRDSQRQAASQTANARDLEARAQQRLSQIGWADLQRQIADLKLQVEEATKLDSLNQRKVEAERGRYKLGRTTAFQLITFEIDASNSQLTLSRILADLRKAESRARIFTRLQQDGV